MNKEIKVFSLSKNHEVNLGWFNSGIYKVEIDHISSDLHAIPTSIPSPYAQIDLVKSAFEWLKKPETPLDGETAYHKLVSYTLDVAQLFYEIDKHNGLNIVAYKPEDRFKSYEKAKKDNDNTVLKKHKELFDTLKRFWEQDKDERDGVDAYGKLYNFKFAEKLYFLINDNGEILGSTSPITLFMPAPDAEKVAKKMNLTIGNHKPFSDKFLPLHKREKEFVEYLILLSKQENFDKFFGELTAYLNRIGNSISINNEKKLEDFTEKLKESGSKNNNCEVLGIKLRKSKGTKRDEIKKDSAFVMLPDYPVDLPPLVLPNEKFSKKWTYTTKGTFWDENYNVPEKNNDESDNAVLPYVKDKYPWLTLGNFLEEKVFRLPYFIDSAYYFTGNTKRFLLPLTEKFFEYFDANKIDQYVETEELAAGGYKITLRIPVKGEEGNSDEVILTKIYNEKEIIDINLHLALMPFVKIKNKHITISNADKEKEDEKQIVKQNPTAYIINVLNYNKDDIFVSFYSDGKHINDTNKIETSIRKHNNPLHKAVKLKNHHLDAIRIKIIDHKKEYKAAIVPKLPEKEESGQYKFAVDVGTTNTHIEFKAEDGNNYDAKAFNHHKEMWKSMFDVANNKDIEDGHLRLKENEYFNKTIIPSIVGTGGDVSFPLRTALMWNKGITENDKIETFMQANNFMLLGIKTKDRDFDVFTDIKWEGTSQNSKLKSYIENILQIIYYKVIVNGGKPENTKIVWFYPVSMGESLINNLKVEWEKIFIKLFGKQNLEDRLLSIPESLAPYFEYENIAAGTTLSIDIGGGSADIGVFDSMGEPQFISSFRFAGNAMFGDAYSHPNLAIKVKNSGFVQAFKEQALEIARMAGNEKLQILNDILQNNQYSREFINFLFQLENEPNVNFSFIELLQINDKLKLNIFIYYAALMYYSAISIKSAGLEPPTNILFSGMGAKSIRILDPNRTEFNIIKHLFEFIFKRIYRIDHYQINKIIMPENPKTITAKGGINIDFDNAKNLKPSVKVWTGTNDKTIIDKGNLPKINAIDFSEISDSINEFYNLLDEYVDSINLRDKFNISNDAYQKFAAFRKRRNIQEDLKHAIRGQNIPENEKISETLFFYPLMELLNQLPNEMMRTRSDYY